jgi:hypothetical protein
LIAQTTLLKKSRLVNYQTLIGRLKDLERKHNATSDPEILRQVKETKNKIDNILLTEVEKLDLLNKPIMREVPKQADYWLDA